jgi:hypothetical protein
MEQCIWQLNGTSAAKGRLAAAAVKLGNGNAENLCHPPMKAEREAVATSRNKAALQRLPERADERNAAD